MGLIDDIKDGASKTVADSTSRTNHIHDGKGAKDVDMRNTILKNPKVLAEKLLKSTPLSGSITIPIQEIQNHDIVYTNTTIPFYLENEFSFSVSNEWKPLLDPNSLVGSFLSMANFLNMSSGAPNVTFQSEALSSRVWKGTTFDGFNISCLFIATNRSIDTIDIIEKLLKTSLPCSIDDYISHGGHGVAAVTALRAAATTASNTVKQGANWIGDKLNNDFGTSLKKVVSDSTSVWDEGVKSLGMVAPLNYGIRFSDAENEQGKIIILPGTTISIDIGDWFTARYLLVESLSNVQFSKEIIAPPTNTQKGKNDLYDPAPNDTKYGYPLYVKCNMKLVPSQILTYNRFKNYFKRPWMPAGGGNQATTSNNEATQLP